MADEAIARSLTPSEVAAWVVYASVILGGAWYAWLNVPFSVENYAVLALFSIGLLATPIAMRARHEISPRAIPVFACVAATLAFIAWLATTTWAFLKASTSATDGQLLAFGAIAVVALVASVNLLSVAKRHAIFSWSVLFVLAVGFATNWAFALVAAAAAGLFYQYYKQHLSSNQPESKSSQSESS